MIVDTCPKWRIALSLAALPNNYFFLFGISEPSTAPYKSFSTEFSQSQGGNVFHGYSQVTLTWANLLPRQTRYIKRFVNLARGGTGLLYLTILENNADSGYRKWLDVSGIPHYMDVTTGGEIAGTRGMFYENVELFLNNLTIINNPAVF